MRFILFFVVICFQTSSFCQNSFAKQIQEAINDTATGFKKIRGKYNSKPTDNIGIPYHFPKKVVEGTKSSKIFSVSTNSYYYMEVINPNSKDSAATDSLLDVWMKKLAAVLDKKFVAGKDSPPAGFKAFYFRGYKFSHGYLSISINHYRPFPDDRKNNVIRIDFKYAPKRYSAR